MGAPRNTHGSTYFQSTDLWNITDVGLVIPDQFQFISKLELQLLILGDGAFPLAKSIKNRMEMLRFQKKNVILTTKEARLEW